MSKPNASVNGPVRGAAQPRSGRRSLARTVFIEQGTGGVCLTIWTNASAAEIRERLGTRLGAVLCLSEQPDHLRMCGGNTVHVTFGNGIDMGIAADIASKL